MRGEIHATAGFHAMLVFFIPYSLFLSNWVMKMAIRAAIVSRRRKDFGGARILAARGRGPRGERGAEGLERGSAAA